MSTPPSSSTRAVRIGADERTGWSSDRPRRDGQDVPRRPIDISVRGRVLRPTDRMRYSPGSLLLIVSSSADERESFAQRVVEDRSALLSSGKVGKLLEGRVPSDQVAAKTAELVGATVAKRLTAGDSVALVLDDLLPETREPFLRLAHAHRRPRHLILLEVGRDAVSEEDRPLVDDLRRSLDAGELGQEGIQTALRLGGRSTGELKKVVFRPAPRDDD